MIAKLWPEMTDAEQVQAILIMEAALLGMCERLAKDMDEILVQGRAPFHVEFKARLVRDGRELSNSNGTAIPGA